MATSTFRKFAVESALIVLSVLFALLLDEWRNNYNEKNRTETMLKNIELELETNQKLVKKLTEYHEKVLYAAYGTLEKDSLEHTFFYNDAFEIYKVAPNGIIQDNFKDIAWEVAKQENISSRIDFATSVKLYEAYSQQEKVNQTIDRILNFLGQREQHRKDLLRETVIVFMLDFNELVGQEKVLSVEYDEALAALRE